MKTWLGLALVAWGLWLGVTVSDAAEAQCGQLDATYGAGTCLCSEPLQATAYTNSVNAFYYNPNDSTTKQCTQLGGGAGEVISVSGSPSPFPMVGNNPTVLAALPAGHSVARYMTQPEGSTGSFDVMGQFNPTTTPSARIAVRWYLYYSPNYVWGASGNCLNSGKWSAPRNGFLEASWGSGSSHGGNSYWLMYGWQGSGGLGWGGVGNAAPDWGPGADVASEPISQLAGKWWRIEFILINNTGTPGARVLVYRKNVTTPGPEYVVIDTAVGCTNPPGGPGCSGNADRSQDWPASLATNLTTPTSLINRIGPELFRNQGVAGGCAGYAAVSHYMVAAWSTNANQRIGAALEVEGEVPGTSPPPILAGQGVYGVTGVNTTLATPLPGPTQIGFIHTAAMLVILIVAVLAGRGVRR